MVLFDATFMIFLFVPNSPCRVDTPRDRINELIGTLHGRGEKIIVPTPALSELLVKAGDSRKQILYELTRTGRFQIEPFDLKAAIEVALMTEAELKKGQKRGSSTETWAKIKYDRQIVAIGKVLNVTAIYSEDGDVRTLAASNGLNAKGIADCNLPYEMKKRADGTLPFPTSEEEKATDETNS